MISSAQRTASERSNRRRYALSAVKVCQLACREDAGGDQQHALATFVHPGSLALSPYIRHFIGKLALGQEQSTTSRRDGKALSTWSQRLFFDL